VGRIHAIVIGASVAGLTAAQALAGRFDQVTMLDRDTLPSGPLPRRGVPQGHHPHVLLASGQAALDELFPGFKEELVAGGAVPFESGRDMRVHRYGEVWPSADTEPTAWTIEKVDTIPHKSGSPGIYGDGISEVYFDNVKVYKNQ